MSAPWVLAQFSQNTNVQQLYAVEYANGCVGGQVVGTTHEQPWHSHLLLLTHLAARSVLSVALGQVAVLAPTKWPSVQPMATPY